MSNRKPNQSDSIQDALKIACEVLSKELGLRGFDSQFMPTEVAINDPNASTHAGRMMEAYDGGMTAMRVTLEGRLTHGRTDLPVDTPGRDTSRGEIAGLRGVVASLRNFKARVHHLVHEGVVPNQHTLNQMVADERQIFQTLLHTLNRMHDAEGQLEAAEHRTDEDRFIERLRLKVADQWGAEHKHVLTKFTEWLIEERSASGFSDAPGNTQRTVSAVELVSEFLSESNGG